MLFGKASFIKAQRIVRKHQFQTEGNADFIQEMSGAQYTELFLAAPVIDMIPNPPWSSMCYCPCGHISQHGFWILVPDVPAQVNRAPYPTRPEPSIQVRQTTQQMAYFTDVLPLPNSSTATANVGLGDMSVERKTLMKTGSSEGPGIGCSMAVTGDERESGDAPLEMGVGDLRIPTSEPGFQGNGSQTPLEDDLKKRERRRMKNREAARMCRRKKNEYIRCLENRLAELEEQNSSLIEEFKALQSRVTPQQRSGTAIL